MLYLKRKVTNITIITQVRDVFSQLKILTPRKVTIVTKVTDITIVTQIRDVFSQLKILTLLKVTIVTKVTDITRIFSGCQSMF